MAPRRSRRSLPPRLRTVLLPPDEACWIENDSVDRAVFARLRAESPSLRSVAESGAHLVPHFEQLLQDVFSLLYKHNVVLRPPDAGPPSALANRLVLEGLRESAGVRALRLQTPLDDVRAGLGAVLLGEAVLALLRREEVLTRRELLDLWDLAHEEEKLRDQAGAAEEARDIYESAAEAARKAAAAAVAESLSGEAQARAKALGRKARRHAEDLERKAEGAARRLGGIAVAAAQGLSASEEEGEAWSRQVGGGLAGSSPARQIELGRRLATNPKLRRFAALVGRMREHALALRQRLLERSSEELYEIGRGSDLSRLLPHELLALRHPALRADFMRRLLDGEILQYSLRGVERKGKGPMVVCLDGSGSMAGEKELWAKAVTLTLLDIARRQRRLFRAVCFSAADTPLRVLDLTTRDRYEADPEKILDLAEYFPGGGTDFETPLDAAVDCLHRARYRRGDIVLITDGECRVSPQWKAGFLREKKALGFSLFSVLIDVGPSSSGTVRELSDKVAAVSTLTHEGAGEIFLKV